MAKVTRFARFSSGVFEACRDLFAPYAGQASTNFDDDGTVAAVEVQANELAVPVDDAGAVAAQTKAPLGTTTYTSAVFQTQGFGRLVGTVFSDANATLKVEQSSDGENFDLSTSVSVTGGTGDSFSEEVVAPYARVVLTPGSSQAELRLYTWLRRTGTA